MVRSAAPSPSCRSAAASISRPVTRRVRKGAVQEDSKMKTYIVSTHLGDQETTATSPQKAISNIRFRIFGPRSAIAKRYVQGWTVKEA